MFVLAHISDIHLNYPPYLYELSLKRIIGLANWHFNRKKYLSHEVVKLLINDISSHNADHIAITGDLVNMTSKREVYAAKNWLKSIGNPNDISIVFGNHDAYVSGSKEKSLRAWKKYIAGDTTCTRGKIFPYMRVRNNVALIGCSTVVNTPPFISNGYFGQKQADDTSQLLCKAKQDGLFRIIMMHHPPVLDESSIYNRMFGIKRFQDVIAKEGVELILHGHTHLNSLHWMTSQETVAPVVGVASASQKKATRKPMASYNLFYIAKNYNNWTLRGERYTLSPDATHIKKECSNIFHNNHG
ncbi:MAG: metallophosphatase [Candidatus Liberibacter europaeus]|uniref:Metallophosphatase n=1 Tax=Candidatus Liberibacter europaeus TaxID=744859 RepID=A0A2T4VYL3_9HYPH|nr:metallophosphatase [Candidatus Liberibacter europaeus]PTL86870.1 MAG: metallophosphatase [Candidatus Liberibacter europaeus]